MSSAETFTLIQGIDRTIARQMFERNYTHLAPLASRYAKNHTQAEELLHNCFNVSFNKLKGLKNEENEKLRADLDQHFKKEFIQEAINFVKSIRSEYYVASTVYAQGENKTKNYNLFENNDVIDFAEIENEVLIKCLQQLVPSQRLVFNLHVVEGYSIQETALMLESSEGTVKSNLEKARFNFQKNIEKTLKNVKA